MLRVRVQQVCDTRRYENNSAQADNVGRAIDNDTNFSEVENNHLIIKKGDVEG